MKAADSVKLVDYHCHLDLYPDYEKRFADCGSANVELLAVTTTPKAWPRNKELCARFPHIRVALGLHPQLVGERPNELRIFENYLAETHFVGEVGLDASPRYYASFAEQKRIFQHILRMCAEAGDKILSIHSARSAREVLNCIELSLAGSRSRPVLHWFTGSNADAKRAVELGCYFSVNEQMFASPTIHRMLEVIPPNRLLTETDGPFLQIQNRPAQPGEVGGVVGMLAQALKRSTMQVEELLLNNLVVLERRSE
jgi:TatD DNase family protein